MLYAQTLRRTTVLGTMFGKGHDYKGSRISPMQLMILLLLRKRPMYGYEILKELRERFKGVLTPQNRFHISLDKATGGAWSRQVGEERGYGLLFPFGRGGKMGGRKVTPFSQEGPTSYSLPEDDRGAAADMNLNGEETESECKENPIVDLFEGEDPDNAHRAKRLRMAKEHIAEHLAMIDKELKELESTNENGGKIE